MGKATKSFFNWQAFKVFMVVALLIGATLFTLVICMDENDKNILDLGVLDIALLTGLVVAVFIFFLGQESLMFYKFLRDVRFIKTSQYSHILEYMLIPSHNTLTLTEETKESIKELARIIADGEKSKLDELQDYLSRHLDSKHKVKAYIDAYDSLSSKERSFIYGEIKGDVNKLRSISVDYLTMMIEGRNADKVSSILNKHTTQ